MSVISALPLPFVKHCPQQENWTFRRLTFSRAQNCFLGARTTLWATDKYYTKKSYAGVIFRPLPSLSLLSPPLKMKLKTALFFLAMVAQRHRLALSTPRPRVVTSGPTMGPNFSRMTGKREFFWKSKSSLQLQKLVLSIAMEKCPDSHPYPFDGGKHCCKSPIKVNDTSASLALDCDGGRLRIGSSLECCLDGMYLACSDQVVGCNNGKSIFGLIASSSIFACTVYLFG